MQACCFIALCYIGADHMTDRSQMNIRLPNDLRDWIKTEAERNGRSQNSEVVQVLRAAMTRTEPTTT